MNQALYRRYRPENFGEVIGQEHVTEPLTQALRTGRVSHAYLFSGPRGCGKTTCARILARCLNCEKGPTPGPCGECASCQELGRGGGGSLDVVEIDAASHGGVDDTRDLREKAVFAPARDRYKIFVLDEAHMVSREGFNALLKIVEEPPPHVKFIFATTEPNKVLPTIRSRSHHYPFRLVPPGLMTSYMAQLAKSEDVEVAPGVMQMVVRAGGGSVRDTESVLDQLIGGSIDGHVTYEGAASLLGFTPEELINQMVSALDRGDGAAMFSVIESVVESGLEPHRFAEDLLERLRDLIVLAAAGPSARQALRGLPEDQVAALAEQAGHFGFGRLTGTADSVSAGLATMAGATSPRLHLELLAARALQAASPSTPPPGLSATTSSPDAVPAAASPSRVAASAPSQERPEAEPAPVTGPATGWAIPGVTTGSTWADPTRPSNTARPPGRTQSVAPDATSHVATGSPGRGPGQPAVPGPGNPAVTTPQRQFVDWDEPDRTPPPGAGGHPPSGRPPQPPAADCRQRPTAPPPRQPDGPPPVRPPAPNRPDRRPWDRILGQVRRHSATAFGLLSHSASLVAMEPGHLTLAFETPDLAATFGRRFQGIAEQAATELAGHPVKISAVVIGSPPASPPTPPLPAGPPAAAAPGRVQDASGSSFAGPENVSGRRLADKPPSRPAPEPGDTAARPVSATVATASAVPPIQATPPAEAAVDFDVPDEFEDDPLTDGGDDVRALTGVPLVVEMLGAEIIEDTDGE